MEATSAAELVACAEQSGGGAWTFRPFSNAGARAFQWSDSDLEGMKLWHRLRVVSGEVDLPKVQGVVVEADDSVWSWWWAMDQAPWLMAGCGVSAVMLVGAWWLWRRERPVLLLEHVTRRWPELEVLQLEGASKAVLDVAMNGVREQLLPGRGDRNQWVWSELNDREQECAGYIVQGLAPDDIARMMHCTPKHIYNLRSNIRKRLDLPKEADLEAALRARADA
jgi:DNA-binding CsgD family transcriptional regulator